LTYVVVDECHHYRGVFGAHVSHVLRRLRRVCAMYGANPTFVLASATVAEPEVTASRLTGLDDNGNVVWSGTDDQVLGIAEVLTPTYQPGRASWQLAGSGQFIQATDGQFSLVDGLTGELKWSVDSTDWGIESSSMPIRAVSDGQTLAISGIGSEAASIRVDPESGENLGRAPWISNALRGMHVVYSLLDGKITATDVKTGTPLWAIDSDADGLFFAGGRLVTFEGNTIRSVG
jgi:outer membrane protein assembly factor BamB